MLFVLSFICIIFCLIFFSFFERERKTMVWVRMCGKSGREKTNCMKIIRNKIIIHYDVFVNN